MEPALITALVSLAMAASAGIAAWKAHVRSNRTTESQVITVTVAAAENVVELVTAQLDRSISDYQRLSARVDDLEEALTEEKTRSFQLTMQLGKVRKRVLTLEEFIKERGWEPPPFLNGEEI